MAISKLILNSEVQMDVTQDTVTAQTLLENETATGADGEPIVGTYVAPTPRTASDVTVSGATVTIPSGAYALQVQKSVATGTAGTPTATKGTVSNHAVSVIPSVTNTTGYITGSTKTGTAVSVSASELVSGTYSVTGSGTVDVTNYASISVPSGTAGTPTATKGTVSNHSVTVTPSVTNITGYIAGGTKTGTAVSVSASELVSGTKSITQNGTGIDVAEFSTVDVNVSSGGGGMGQYDFYTILDASSGFEPLDTYDDIYDAYETYGDIGLEVNGYYSPDAVSGPYDSAWWEGDLFSGTSPLGTTFDGDVFQFYAVEETTSGYVKYTLWFGQVSGVDTTEIESTETFYDTSDATAINSDVANGKIYYGVSGQGTGTASGGGSDDVLVEVMNKTISGTFSESAVRNIGSWFFYHCDNLLGVDCPNVSYIYTSAFADCFNMTNVSFPNATYIAGSAFARCYSMLTADFPKVTSIESYAFVSCIYLSTANFSSVKTIGSYAFDKCSRLTTISFPVATSIGGAAFSNCSSLTIASFPSVSSIGASAFSNCKSLTTVSFPIVKTIGSYAFNFCTGLTTVSFPSAVNIYPSAFASCSNLTTAYFPLVSTINGYAFYQCNKLTTISFPIVSNIYQNAFQYCSSLATVNFPSVSYIGASAFYGCREMSIISFPVVSDIYSYAFYSCSALQSAYFLTSGVPSLRNANVFASTPMSLSTYLGYFGSIFVKESLLASFKTATNWSNYSLRMVGLTDAQIAAL